MDSLHKLHHRLWNIDGFARIKKSFSVTSFSLHCYAHSHRWTYCSLLCFVPVLSGAESTGRRHAGKAYSDLNPISFLCATKRNSSKTFPLVWTVPVWIVRVQTASVSWGERHSCISARALRLMLQAEGDWCKGDSMPKGHGTESGRESGRQPEGYLAGIDPRSA